MYLGYYHKEELSLLVSRLTLHFQKEIKLYFFSEVEVNGKWLQGFSVSGLNQELSLSVAQECIKGFKHIFINKENLPHEVLFVVCENKDVINSWYQMRWEGLVADRVCRKFDFFCIPADPEDVAEYRALIEIELTDRLCIE